MWDAGHLRSSSSSSSSRRCWYSNAAFASSCASSSSTRHILAFPASAGIWKGSACYFSWSRRLPYHGAEVGPEGKKHFSSSGTGGGGGTSSSGNKPFEMDAESRRSIIQSAGTIEKSVETVKLALAGSIAIFAAKILAYMQSGSSSMLAEAIHSLVDGGNQALLLVGLRTAGAAPDRTHQYGYGKSIYFWSLVSALGTFWMGAGVSLRHSVEDFLDPNLAVDSIGGLTWGVLCFSFAVDAAVLMRSISQINESRLPGESFLTHVGRVRDPTTLAILMEDSASCVGILVAVAGVGLAQLTGVPRFDAAGGVAISFLLAGIGLYLARLNQRFLIGQAVEPEVQRKIVDVLESRPGIEKVRSVQSQWVGPYYFSFKAEIDFDGTYIAAQLMSRYWGEFASVKDMEDMELLLAWYAEDVVRATEREVREAEAEVRAMCPEAAFIELEPDSSTAMNYAIDSNKLDNLRRLERAKMKELLKTLSAAAHTTASVTSISRGKSGGGEGGKDSENDADKDR
jgi:zinc transporter 9